MSTLARMPAPRAVAAGRHTRWMAQLVLAASALTTIGAASIPAHAATRPAPVVQDWPTYVHDTARSGFTADSVVTPANAGRLHPRLHWPVNLGGEPITTQPLIVNGLVYSGSWDGNEYAFSTAGSLIWKTALGITDPNNSACEVPVGVASTAAVARVTVSGDRHPTSVLFVGAGGNDAVGGGSARVDALDAASGAIRWSVPVGASPAAFMWSSPVVYTPAGATVPSVYIGLASYGDCPLVQGKVLQFDARNGALQHEFDTVPQGCVGGSVWGSPTIDASDGSVYVATGNGDPCNTPGVHNKSVLKLRAWDLTLVSSWQIPVKQSFPDDDFGSAPTLFTGTVTPGGAQRSLVGIAAKTGIFYVFNRQNLAAGPVARLHIALPGGPDQGLGSISPAAWDGSRLYVGGGQPNGSNSSMQGVIDAWDPNNLSAPAWTDPLPGTVLGAVTAAPGIVVFGQGSVLSVVRASDGVGLRWLVGGSGTFWGAPSISHGVLYEGDTDGNLFAYGVK